MLILMPEAAFTRKLHAPVRMPHKQCLNPCTWIRSHRQPLHHQAASPQSNPPTWVGSHRQRIVVQAVIDHHHALRVASILHHTAQGTILFNKKTQSLKAHFGKKGELHLAAGRPIWVATPPRPLLALHKALPAGQP